MTSQLPDDAITAAQAFAEMASIYLGEAADDTFDAQHRATRASTARTLLKAALARLDDLLTEKGDTMTGQLPDNAVTAERERIRHLGHETEGNDGKYLLIRADLLGGMADGAHTPGGAT